MLVSAGQDSIVWQLRALRVLFGVLVGAGLALVGSVLQAVTCNLLADSYLFGVSSGVAFGAVVVVLYLGEFVGLLVFGAA